MAAEAPSGGRCPASCLTCHGVASFVRQVGHGLEQGLFGRVGVEVPLCLWVPAVLSQTCGNKDLNRRFHHRNPCCWRDDQKTTDLDSFGSDVKHADSASNEVADGFEVHAADAPGAVHQQNDVRLCLGPTLSVCRDVGGAVSRCLVERIKKKKNADNSCICV